MQNFIAENSTYIAIVISLIIGYLIGKTNGKAETMTAIANQQMRIDAERAQQQMMADMMRGMNISKE